MNATLLSPRSPRRRMRRAFALAGALLAAVLAIGMTPSAEAHGRHGHAQRGHRVVRVHGHRHGFVAPSYISAAHVGVYRPYFRDRVYYAPHRHRHAVYYFPVYRNHVWVDEPHFYCGGTLFPQGYVAYNGPRVSFSVGF